MVREWYTHRQFREKKAYPFVIELLNLPIESIDRLLGDMLTETILKIITAIFDGDPEPLFALLIHPKAHETVRWVVVDCLSALILENLLDKDIVILRLQNIVASGTMNQVQGFFTPIACLTINRKLEPLYDIVRAAFKAGMIDSNYMGIALFESGIMKPIEQITQEEGWSPLTDASKELLGWSIYSHENPVPVNIERNAPCPCGSGRKFKRCCIHRL
ncbi:MAG: DUF1186 domain-containing protein [Parachlamydiaceae bacterium]